MADIFLSYKRENRACAERFAKLFRDERFSVWWDNDITPRQAWDSTIEREISGASSVVVLWSPLSVASDWVRNEAHYGHDRSKLVPVMVEKCDLPLAFRLTQTIDLCDWDGSDENRQWRKLLTWIADLKTPAAPPDAAAGNSFHAVVGKTAAGEPIVDGALVNAATPAGTLFRDHADAPVMRVLPAGDFLMGGLPSDPDRTSTEGPQKRIRIGRPFAMAIYPVTLAQYQCYGPAAPAPAPAKPALHHWFTRDRPVPAPGRVPASAPNSAASSISFDDAQRFARALSQTVSASYRLPSEAEWEYACRSGSSCRFNWGDTIDASHALYREAPSPPTGPAAPGLYPPNAFGLYDMHGNVREWTEDRWHENYDLMPPDGSAALDGHSAMRVTRGGGWSDPPSMLRCSARGRATETIRSDVIGLRMVRSL